MPSCRDRFTGADFEFLTAVLAAEDRAVHLAKLWEDDEALREILDLKPVLRGLLDSPAALRVSPSFYFYVLVRHAFMEAGLDDAALADYVAAVLVGRVAASPGDLGADGAGELMHAADFLAVISSAHGRMRFHLQVAAGNQFLVLTGLYPGFLKRRCERCGAPDIAFYEAFASQAFRGAADSPQVPDAASRRVFGLLSEAFRDARLSLNKVAEEFVFLGE